MGKKLNEKQIVLPATESNEGQIVIMAGAPGSGKNFTLDNFTNVSRFFKTLDIDDIKYLIIKSDILFEKFVKWLNDKTDNYEDYTEIELRHPTMFKDPVFVDYLYRFISENKLSERRIETFLKAQDKDKLPNLVINTTFGNVENSKEKLNKFLEHGYKPENVHVIWVFTSLDEAMENNDLRPRTVSHPYIKETYKKIFQNMYKNIMGGNVGSIFTDQIKGDMWIVVNSKALTSFYFDSPVIKDFYYLKVRENGKWNTSKIFEFSEWVSENIE